ncbi:MAG: hypothetical protein ABW104_05025 [Candidatus Thiodiazotropha sp. 6PLUC2]
MKNRLLMMTGLSLVASSMFTSEAVIANDSVVSPCVKTAKYMYRACRSDESDDFKTSLANCLNLAETGERRACRREAQMVRKEDAEFCHDQMDARSEACEVLNEHRYDSDPLLDPTLTFLDPDEIDESNANPYVSLVAGHTAVVRAGEEAEETVIIHVTDESREIQGVLCRVVADAVVVTETDDEDGSIDYQPVEITDDWFAQDIHGDVYYCGEISRNYEDGVLVDIDGSFESGRDFAKAGLLIMSMPQIDVAHRQEFSLGEAEDIVQYIDLAAIPNQENELYPCSDAGGCLMTYDFAPLDPEATEFKYYIPGIGFVLAEAMEDGELTGEREELICAGDSLDILHQPQCGIENPEKLLAELCKLSPDAFCE